MDNLFSIGAGIAATIGIGVLMFALAVVVFTVIVSWKMYEKAGKEGWKSIIPIYSTIVKLDIIGYKWYYVFFLLLNGISYIGPVIVMLFTILYSIKLAKSFGQSVSFGIGLAFLPTIFIAIIAFDKDIKYIGKTVNGDIDFSDLF